jgi:CheY-like chemotaxis protein
MKLPDGRWDGRSTGSRAPDGGKRVAREMLILDSESPQMRRLATRLQRLGYPVIPAKTTDAAERLLSSSSRRIAAAVIPVDLPTFDLRTALRFLRRQEPTGELCFVAAGHRPEAEGRRLLRMAGVELALWEPLDEHALRFQANRALAGSEIVRGQRCVLRAPANWSVSVWSGQRRKPARIYSLSSAGAFLATGRPSLPGTRVQVELPFRSTPIQVAAEVTMTNVPGHFLRDNLPVGMGVRFETAPRNVESALSIWAERRLESLGF